MEQLQKPSLLYLLLHVDLKLLSEVTAGRAQGKDEDEPSDEYRAGPRSYK